MILFIEDYGVDIVETLRGRLAQLDRVLASEARCREFESHIAHQ
ncbi:MAG: hypothetical protein H6Q49_295 [Deltaproteobacteria bacterium]|nr:hypothetical protein [Deltaproteobacteria bacterium]